jgi:hypothetical protein
MSAVSAMCKANGGIRAGIVTCAWFERGRRRAADAGTAHRGVPEPGRSRSAVANGLGSASPVVNN